MELCAQFWKIMCITIHFWRLCVCWLILVTHAIIHLQRRTFVINLQADKRSLSQPVFDADDVPVVTVDCVESSDGHLNMSADSAISSTSVVSSTFEPPGDIVSITVNLRYSKLSTPTDTADTTITIFSHLLAQQRKPRKKRNLKWNSVV